MLKIRDLQVEVEGKKILDGLDLEVKAGEVHAIMGPNGSGKSTLSHVLAGREGYVVTGGEVLFNGQNLLELAPEERAWQGVFLAMQYPVELPGVNNMMFIREAINAARHAHNQPELDTVEFLKILREKATMLQLDDKLLQRNVNEGFSGGEKKRNEMLQMAMLEPVLAILDETDSGLDIDALRIIAEGVNSLRSKDRAFILVTHYQRLLEYIEPDTVHVLVNGRIVRSGSKQLALELEQKGYQWLLEENAA